MNVRTIGALGLAATFTLTACGSSAPSTLTKAEWVTQANAICKDLSDRSKVIEPKSQSELGPAITKLAQISAEDLAKLSALNPPTEIQSDVAAMVADYQKANQGIQDAAAKVATGDVQGATVTLETAATAGKAGDPIATRLGATECAKE